jgi:hypothetical protein
VTIAQRPLCPQNLPECANGRFSQNRPSLELSPPTIFARMGVMQAINRHQVKDFDTSRKPHHWAIGKNSDETNDRLDLRRHPDLSRSDGLGSSIKLVAPDQRAIGTDGNHAHAGQREFDEEDFISLMAVRATIAQRFAVYLATLHSEQPFCPSAAFYTGRPMRIRIYVNNRSVSEVPRVSESLKLGLAFSVRSQTLGTAGGTNDNLPAL